MTTTEELPEPAQPPAYTIEPVGDFVEVPTDRYMTTSDLLDAISDVWPEGIDLDPFHDPSSIVDAVHTLDVRRGEDAYRAPWSEVLRTKIGERPSVQPWTVFANGPYSSDNPAKTAAACARALRDGCRVMSLCPAAPGSEYWRRFVWPWATAIAWLGRWSFVAGTDIPDKSGRVIARKGDRVHGNRTEIAMLHLGPVREARAFCEIFRSKIGVRAELVNP